MDVEGLKARWCVWIVGRKYVLAQTKQGFQKDEKCGARKERGDLVGKGGGSWKLVSSCQRKISAVKITPFICHTCFHVFMFHVKMSCQTCCPSYFCGETHFLHSYHSVVSIKKVPLSDYNRIVI